MRTITRICYPGIVALVLSASAFAQTSATPMDIGLQAYHDYHGGAIDHINMDNGSLTLDIPLVSYPQRGNLLKMNFDLVYSGNPYSFQTICPDPGSGFPCQNQWVGLGYGGGPFGSLSPLESMSPYTELSVVDTQWVDRSAQEYEISETSNYLQPFWMDYTSATHPGWQAANGGGASDSISIDGSNYQLNMTTSLTDAWTTEEQGQCHWACLVPWLNGMTTYPDPVVTTHDGLSYITSPPVPFNYLGYPWYRMDPDGNYIETTGTGFVDTFGRQIPAVSMNTSPSGSDIAASNCGGPLATAEIGTWSVPGYSKPYYFCYANATVNVIDDNGWSDSEYPVSWTQLVLQQVVLPNLQAWTFLYNATYTGCEMMAGEPFNAGDLGEIILPTGGSISYTYTCVASNRVFPTFDTPVTTAVASRTVSTTSNPANGSEWKYSYTLQNVEPVTTITDPMGNDTVQTLNGTRVTKYYGGTSTSGTLLKTDTRTYSGINTAYGEFPLYPTTEAITLADGETSTTQMQYCCDITFDSAFGTPWPNQRANYGSMIGKQQSGFPGDLSYTSTSTWYLGLNGGDYLNLGLFSEPTSVSVLDSDWITTLASTTYGHDETSPVASGITSSAGPSWTSQAMFGVRGHRTSQTQWNNVGTPVNLKSTTSFYDTGEVYQTTDPLQHTTATYQYPATFRYALPNSVTNALGQSTNFTYRNDTGQKLTSTDPNQNTTTYKYWNSAGIYDPLNRLEEIDNPDLGYAKIQYNDTGAIGATISQGLTSTSAKTTQYIVDGLGRDSETILTDPEGNDTTLTNYDALGRVASVYNPYRTSGDSTYGWTQFAYDALGRKVSQVAQDGTSKQWWCYDGIATNSQPNCNGRVTGSVGQWVDFADENSNNTQQYQDGLGRLIKVVEPRSLQTTYSYDEMNNLKTVTQTGNGTTDVARSRSFNYDSVSRLISSTNPETGTIGYNYDANGNVHTRTDARSVTTTYGYDWLNRLLSKSYSDGATLSSCYQYSATGIANSIGRLSAEWTQAGTCPGSAPTSGFLTKRTFLAYDAMGRVLGEQQCTPNASGQGNCTTSSPSPFALSYFYDLAGDPTAYTNGVNNVPGVGAIAFGLQYDGVGRLQNLNSSWNPATNSTGSPFSLFTADPTNGYTAPGGIQNLIFGNNIFVNKTYDNRLRTTAETATHP